MTPATVLGRFLPGDGFLHRLDPRAKLLALVFISASGLAASRLPFLAGLAILLLAVHGMAGLAPGPLLRSLRGFLWLFLFTVVAQAAWAPGEALWRCRLGPLTLSLTPAGLGQSLLIFLRLFIFIVAGHLLAATTSPTRLGNALGWFLAPLSRFGLPCGETALAFAIGLQFLPLLQDEAAVIRDAQVSRGIGHLDPNPLVRLKCLAALLVPVVVTAVRRSETLALAMVCRGYREGGHRTALHPLSFRGSDALALAATAGILAAALCS